MVKSCSKCGSTDRLHHCAKCPDVFYCSKDHQAAHWATHRRICGAKRGKLDSFDYFDRAAYTKDTAQNLATSVGLQLSSNGDSGIAAPVRRLITAGKDNPENLALLFGPKWSDAGSSGTNHRDARISVLLNAPPGSPDRVLSRHQDSGYNGPRSVRPPDAREQAIINEVRAIQTEVAKQYPPGQEIPGAAMQEFMPLLGADWVEKLPVLQLAMNTTNQGVNQ